MEKRSAVSTMFIDVGGVVLTNGWDRNSRRMAAEKFDLDYEEMNERHHLTYDTYESGKISLDEYLDRVIFYEERNFSHDKFKKFMYAQSKAYQEMIDLVKSLKSTYKLRIGVISNEGRELTEYRIRKFNLKEFVDFFVCSCFVHIRKPDRKIFQMGLDLAQAFPEHSLYIDDREMFVEIANGLGIKSVHHTTPDATILALRSFGLNVG